ncbi:MAG: molybdopterin-dependent oxidoreductase [Actinomycetota bacterium]|nr:molybdopterin-dependent oxidoreductase [Actinomycetota bacterium]
MTDRLESFVVAVAELIIDIAPGGVVRASIETLGTAQKTVLLIGVAAGTLGLGALIGLVARKQQIWAVYLYAGVGVFGAWAIARNPLTSAGLSWVVGAIAVTVGVVTLLRAPLGALPLEQGPEDPKNTYADRREFIGWMSGMSVAAGAMTGVGRVVLSDESIQNARGRVVLPSATTTENTASPRRTPSANSAPPTTEAATVPPEVAEVANLSPYITPNETFYRIDTALSVPMVDPEAWSLSVEGLVKNPYRLTFNDLLAMDLIERTVTLCCVSNEVGGSLVGNATWTGVPLQDVLSPAEPLLNAAQVMAQSVDGFTAGFPIEQVSDGRTALLAIGMNGKPLPIIHGFPARLVVAGLYGYVSAVKWLDAIKITTWEDNDGYWIPRGWAKEAPIKLASRIDVPKSSQLKAGMQPVAGVAWSPTEGVSQVEVSVDGGPWQTCELGDTVGGETWVQWLYRWEAKPGRHELTVRAVGSDGAVQPSRSVSPAPNGAEGHHSVKVTVL